MCPEYQCEECGESFDTECGLHNHIAKIHDPPWQDKSTLEEMYSENGLSPTEIANQFIVCEATITRWLQKHELKNGPARRPAGWPLDEEQEEALLERISLPDPKR